MPTTMMVTRNCRSYAGPCSEMAAGNHQRPFTNNHTERPVITQRNTARARPISRLLCVNREPSIVTRRGSSPGMESRLHLVTVHGLRSFVEDHQPEQDGQVEHGSEEQPARALARVRHGRVDARPQEQDAEDKGAVEVDGAGRPQHGWEEAD